jgi:uncharacterized membrane protein
MKRYDNIQSKKQYAIPCILISIAGGASWAFHSGNYLMMTYLILSATAVLYFHRYRQEEGLKDERIQYIYHLTSWATLQFSILFFASAGAFLISMQGLYPQYASLSFHLAYISCGVFLLYTLFHIYFSKKYGA